MAFIKSRGNAEGDIQDKYLYNSYSGADIVAAIYLPALTKGTGKKENPIKFKVFANLQTISISSTRSISPVRVLGRSSPVAYCRGGRTFAGTMIFASIDKDAFISVYDEAIAESAVNSMRSFTPDQMPPFSIVITMGSEKGGAAYQIINGITLVNYGTTYSIDDIYSEQQYTFLATEATPLISDDTIGKADLKHNSTVDVYRKVEDYLSSVYKQAFPGSPGPALSNIVLRKLAEQQTRDEYTQAGERQDSAIRARNKF